MSEWIECVADSRYEILNVYPYPIRKKGSTRCVSTFINKNTQFVEVHLGGRTWKLHRVIALQFIPNPHNFSKVAHLNGNKFDNHIQNLFWCNPIRRPEPTQEPTQEKASAFGGESTQEPASAFGEEPNFDIDNLPRYFYGYNFSNDNDEWWPFSN